MGATCCCLIQMEQLSRALAFVTESGANLALRSAWLPSRHRKTPVGHLSVSQRHENAVPTRSSLGDLSIPPVVTADNGSVNS